VRLEIGLIPECCTESFLNYLLRKVVFPVLGPPMSEILIVSYIIF